MLVCRVRTIILLGYLCRIVVLVIVLMGRASGVSLQGKNNNSVRLCMTLCVYFYVFFNICLPLLCCLLRFALTCHCHPTFTKSSTREMDVSVHDHQFTSNHHSIACTVLYFPKIIFVICKYFQMYNFVVSLRCYYSNWNNNDWTYVSRMSQLRRPLIYILRQNIYCLPLPPHGLCSDFVHFPTVCCLSINQLTYCLHTHILM